MTAECVCVLAGCSVSGYCSDLTRTWPVDKRFTEPQRLLYDIVLETQTELISLCHSQHTLDQLFDAMCHILGDKLVQAGVFKKSTNKDYPSKVEFLTK